MSLVRRLPVGTRVTSLPVLLGSGAALGPRDVPLIIGAGAIGLSAWRRWRGAVSRRDAVLLISQFATATDAGG